MLLAFFLGIIGGVALQLQQVQLWQALPYGLCLGLGFAGVWLAKLPRLGGLNRWIRSGFVLLFAACLSFGTTGWRSVSFSQTAMNPALEGIDLDVVGVVSAMPQRLDTGLRFRFEVEAAHQDNQAVVLPPRILLSWYKRDWHDDAGTLVDPLGSGTLTPKAGERWQLTVRLKAPHGNANPHGFDYELWAWEQGVQATGYVRDSKRLVPPKRLGQLSLADSAGLAYWVQRARQATRDAVFERLGVRLGQADERASAGVIAALITGDQNAIERADWDIFRATGTAHLMSISGLHITMFAWMAALLIGRLWRQSARAQSQWLQRLCLRLPASQAAVVGGLLLATLYAWFSGWGVPAQRTVWMLATVTLLRLLGLRWPWYVTWLLAAAVVLTVDPWALLSAGFWLSFIAVAVLFASDNQSAHTEGEPPKPMGWKKTLMKLWGLLREQWVITLALAPLTLLFFQQVSLVGLLANALAIPMVTLLITPLAMLGALIPALWDIAASSITWLGTVLKGLAALPFAVYSAAAAPWAWSALAAVGGVLLVLPLNLKKRFMAIALGLLFMMPALVWQPSRPAVGEFELLAIDIGQGNAVLIQTANHSLLYDAGPRFSKESDAGHRTVVPLLRALGVRLDALMLSHRDSDHTGGAKAVHAAQPQARIMTSALLPKDRMDMGLPSHVPLEPCMAGQSWHWDGVRFEVLHPQPAQLAVASAGGKEIKPNTLSCVLKISNSDALNPQAALLVGDIELAQENELVNTYADQQLAATVLLVPHHGSKTSSGDAFLEAVKPKWAIVQAGYRNRFAHPRPEVMSRYTERNIQTVLSPACGAALWRSNQPDGVLCQRRAQQRYWTHQPL